MGKKYCSCGQLAKWCYAPGYSSGASPYSCDDCVMQVDSAGCSCNWKHAMGEYAEEPVGVNGVDWKWVIKEKTDYQTSITLANKIWVDLDPKGRPWPCSEYDYDIEENNFEDDSTD